MIKAVRNRLFPYRELPSDLQCCHVNRVKPWIIGIAEKLNTSAPKEAYPFCCYAQTVIFYKWPYTDDGTGNYQKWDSIETKLRCDDVLLYEGEEYAINGGHVMRSDAIWLMSWSARKV